MPCLKGVYTKTVGVHSVSKGMGGTGEGELAPRAWAIFGGVIWLTLIESSDPTPSVDCKKDGTQGQQRIAGGLSVHYVFHVVGSDCGSGLVVGWWAVGP